MYATYKNLSKETTVDQSLLDHVTPIKSIEQKESIIKLNNIVVLDIYADWCGPCKVIAPKYAELAKKYNQVNACMLCKENIDYGMTDKSRITAVPTFLFFKGGKFVDTIIGCDMNKIESKILELSKITT